MNQTGSIIRRRWKITSFYRLHVLNKKFNSRDSIWLDALWKCLGKWEFCWKLEFEREPFKNTSIKMVIISLQIIRSAFSYYLIFKQLSLVWTWQNCRLHMHFHGSRFYFSQSLPWTHLKGIEILIHLKHILEISTYNHH